MLAELTGKPARTEIDAGATAADATRQKRRTSHLLWLTALAALVLVIGVATWSYFSRSAPTPLSSPMKVIPLTSAPGFESHPAFSPDGQQIAFVWNGEKQDNYDIYVKLINAGTPLRLTTHPAADISPAWSPDGRYIAFIRYSETEYSIYLVPALGGPERKLHSVISGPRRGVILDRPFSGRSPRTGTPTPSLAWSPDGKYLAIMDKSRADEPFSVWLLSVETLERHKLTSPPGGYNGDAMPHFSPDGKVLAFGRGTGSAGGDIYLVPIAGGEPKRITFDNQVIAGLDWTADGRGIVFRSSRDGSFRLWRISATGGMPERVAAAGEEAVGLAISRQGHRLAYVKHFDDINIWRIEVPGSTGRSRSPTKLISSTRADISPQYSPDGKRIVFASDRSGSDEIWVCDSEGLNPVQLTFFEGGSPNVGTPRWSPDGQQIAFDSTAEGHRDIYVVGVDGGKPRRLTSEPSNHVRPSWSRDGRWIYFGSNRSGDWQVRKVPAQGGQVVQVTKQVGREAFESPDGKFVYYSKGFDTLGIWRVPVQGGEEIRVLEQGLQGYWAIMDQGIYFLKRNPASRFSIEFFDLATGRTTPVAAVEKEPPEAIPSLAVSPDRRWILYTQVDQSGSNIMLVENFR